MSVEDSISLYKAQTGEGLTFNQVERMFTDSSYAREQFMASENLHKVYRGILNTNIPQTSSDAISGGYEKLSAIKSWYHNPWYNKWQNSKYVGPSGHLEAVYDRGGGLVTDSRYLGTFNFFGPDNASDHWAAEVDPYNKWGN